MRKTPIIGLALAIGGLALVVVLVQYLRPTTFSRPAARVPDNVSTFSEPYKGPPSGSAPSARSKSAAAARGAPGPVVVSRPASSAASGPNVEVIRRPATDPIWNTPLTDPAAVSLRRTVFLPANSAGWTRIDADITRAFRLQAGGNLSLGVDQAGPDGAVRKSTGGARIPSADLVVPAAPFLALVGRVCSRTECSSPFQIGSRAILCPSSIGVQGSLELWTNNRLREDSGATRNNFSAALGGYHVYLEPAPAGACGPDTAAGTFSAEDSAALAAGRTIERPEFTISSSQGSWKPFFLPLDRPLRLRASGEMRPTASAPPTGPDGIRVPNGSTWTYPGTQIVVDSDHPLFERTVPYQAFIGRVCSASACGPLFVVGRERTICAEPPYRDRLELWINHILPPRSLLAQTTSLTMDTFDFQARSGAYRFTVSEGQSAACGAPRASAP